jgi:nitrite reductase/ring-hydroxylating ferredoxin subunit
MWHEVARLDDIAPGGMKYAKAEGREITLCNCDGHIYAVSRRCGHESAPLDQGSLDGWIVTCPMHFAQFDVRSGVNLAWPIDHYLGEEPVPEPVERLFRLEHRLEWKIRANDLDTYAVRVTDGAIEIDI